MSSGFRGGEGFFPFGVCDGCGKGDKEDGDGAHGVVGTEGLRFLFVWLGEV